MEDNKIWGISVFLMGFSVFISGIVLSLEQIVVPLFNLQISEIRYPYRTEGFMLLVIGLIVMVFGFGIARIRSVRTSTSA